MTRVPFIYPRPLYLPRDARVEMILRQHLPGRARQEHIGNRAGGRARERQLIAAADEKCGSNSPSAAQQW